MLLKVYKSRVWVLLFMLLPFIGNAQIPGLPAGWEFTENPNSAVYAIQTSVMYDGVDPLNANDWIGAFYNDNGTMECAGAVQWNGSSNVAIVVFGNDTLAGDKNGFSEGEHITWMFYRDASGMEEEVCTDPDFFWANGALEEIMMFKSCGGDCQTISLEAGFQFISSYIAADDPDIQVVMDPVLDNLDFVRNTAGDQLFYFFGNWQNGIGDWVNEEGYIVKMNNAEDLEICGTKVDPQTPIDLNTGFQFVSYLDETPQDALVAFDGVLDNLEFVRNSAGDQLFFFFGSWQNGIGDLTPGEGYIVKMTADDQLIYPATGGMNAQSSNKTMKAPARGVHWPHLQGLASDPIWTIYIAVADLNGVTLGAGDELAIFDGETLVGSTVLEEEPNGTFNLNLDLKAWHTLDQPGDGFQFGDPFTIKCWDASEDVESTSFTYSYQTAPGAYEGDVFPDGDAISLMEMQFSAEQPEAPELLSADPMDQAVELTWNPIGTPANSAFGAKDRGVHWPHLQGLASDPIWTIYIAIADLNDVTLEVGDELAIFDDQTLVGSTVLEEVPNGTFNLNIDLKAWHTLDQPGDGFQFGNPFTIKCWDASEDVESTAFTYSYQTAPGAYEGDVFPDGDAISLMEMYFTADQPYVPTFNIYVDGALAVEGVEGNTYTVDGLTNGETYCFTVSQILEDETESAQSNELCATLPIPCLDAVINNFPESQDDVCEGTDLVIDFSGVEILNAINTVWSVDPVEAGAFDGTDFVLTTGYVGPVTISLLAEAEAPCMNAEASLSFTVNPLPVVECPTYEPVCEGSEYIDFPLVADGIYFDATGNVVTGFDPAVAGTYTFTLSVINEFGCESYCEFDIVVNALPNVTLTAYEPVCEGSEAFELYGGLPEGGIYYVNGEEMTMFDPAVAGTYELEYVYMDGNGCTNSAMGEIVVNPLPEVTLMAYEPICEGSDAFELYGGMPEGGIYYVNGEPMAMFDPAVAGTYELEYVYVDGNGCTNSAMGEIVVNPLPEVTCPGDMSVQLGDLPLTLEGATPEGGTYSGDGVVDGVFFVEENGSYTITYTYENEFGCVNECSFLILVGQECQDAVINNFPESQDDVCAGTELVIDFSGVEILNAINTEWSVDPMGAGEFVGTDFILNTDYVGTVIVSLFAEAEAPCMSAEASLSFVVNPLPEVTLMAYEPVCAGSEPFELYGGMPEGGVYYVNGEEMTMFDPAMAGTYSLEYMYTDENGCSNSAMGEIVVNPAPEVVCPEDFSVCLNDEPWELYGATPEGGEYTGEYVVDGVFDPMAAGAGDHEVTYTYTNEFGCSGSCTFMITVNPLPYIELGLSATEVCLGEEVIGTITGPEDGAYPYTVEYSINGAVMTDVIDGTPLEIPFVPDMPGLYTLEVLSLYDANGCYAMPIEGVELNVLPLTEITMQPVSVEVLYGEAAEFSVEADNATGYQWFGPDGMIVGADQPTFTIESAMVEDDGDYYVMVYGDCGDVMSDVVTLTVLPWTQVIDFNGLVNGMSTYLSLTEDDLATIFGDLTDNVTFVEFKSPDESWSPLNASFAFDEERGAKVVLNGGFPTSVEVQGYPTLGTMVDLVAGNNYIPVWSQNIVMADDVFTPLGSDLYAVFSLDYSGYWWPTYNLYTLEYLVPGSSYLVIMNNAATADFDVPAVDANPGYADVPRNVTSWKDVTLTATQHNIAITSDAMSQLQVGDVIGAFNEYGQIAGTVEITNTRENTVLRTFGDNPLTDRAEGFVEGDMITIKVWRNGEEMIAQATFDNNMPNQNIFAKEGVSAITNLKLGATSVNDLTAGLQAMLYPNPATDVVNIETNFEIQNIKVVNYVGQVVMNQDVNQVNFQINTSDYRSGMYFVQIETTEGVTITKRLTIK